MSSERILSALESKLFSDYLVVLGREGIPFIILRNYEGFPSKIGHDLDLFIPRTCCDQAAMLFTKLLGELGGRVIITHRRDYFFDIRFIVDLDVSKAIHLDLFHGSFTWHGIPYLTEDELLSSARDYNGLPIPRPAHEALNLLFASILWGGFLKERYISRISALLSEPLEREIFEKCVGHVFGADCQVPFLLTTETSPPKNAVSAYAKLARSGMKRTALKRAPFRTIGALARHWFAEARCYFRPKGIHIAILGPDGAGKSTVMARTVERIGELFAERHFYHWRPSVMPEIGVLLGRRKATKEPTIDPHGKPSHPPLSAFLILIWYWFDYWIGWPLRIWKPTGTNHLVVFDRYASDFFCDPKRYRLARLPTWMRKLAARLVPQPDFTFILCADAQTLLARKSEIPEASLIEIIETYRVWGTGRKNCFLLDAAQSVEKVVADIEGIIVPFLENRERTR